MPKKNSKKTIKRKSPKIKKEYGGMRVFLSKVPENKRFFCSDGSIFSDIYELEKAIRKMDKEVFASHVNSDKNDFSNWIYDVIGDISLADNLRGSSDQKVIAKKIRTRINYIKKKLKS
ncbi:hypothetical protein K9L16_01360 [Candidatus Pacearchaeota archaeon]|nr:hypothetical protein [Candidatus Pacearchaeota archaeon]